MENRYVSLMQTIAANLENKNLTDKEFRTFIRNSIKGMEDLEQIAIKFTTPDEIIPE